MKVIVDTCVLSEVRHPGGNPLVKDMLASTPEEDLFLSVITIGEVTKGVALLDAGRKRNELLKWIDGLKVTYRDRILPLDLDTSIIWGTMTARLQQEGISIPAIDGLLAATALKHNMHVLTRNTRHFEATGALIIDPWRE